MRFDMFEAIGMMEEKLGRDVCIEMNCGINGYYIRLRLFRHGKFHTNQFFVPKKDIESDDALTMFNHQFKRALFELETV